MSIRPFRAPDRLVLVGTCKNPWKNTFTRVNGLACAFTGPGRPDICETSHFRKDFSLFRVITAAEDFRA